METSLNRKLPIKPEVGRILKNCVGTFYCFDPRNLSAKFQPNQFLKTTQLGKFPAEIGGVLLIMKMRRLTLKCVGDLSEENKCYHSIKNEKLT